MLRGFDNAWSEKKGERSSPKRYVPDFETLHSDDKSLAYRRVITEKIGARAKHSVVPTNLDSLRNLHAFVTSHIVLEILASETVLPRRIYKGDKEGVRI